MVFHLSRLSPDGKINVPYIRYTICLQRLGLSVLQAVSSAAIEAATIYRAESCMMHILICGDN